MANSCAHYSALLCTLLALSACATSTPITVPITAPVTQPVTLPAAFAQLGQQPYCQLKLEFYLVDQRLVYVRRSALDCSDSAGGALYGASPEDLLCVSGGVTGAIRCKDEPSRPLFLQLEAQRDLAAPIPGHRIVPARPALPN